VTFSGYTFEADKQYCLVGIFEDDTSSGKATASLYVNTTCGNPGTWSSYSEEITFGTLVNASGVGALYIGQTEDGADYYIGALDEVRYSSSVLPQSEFLCNPEPGTTSLILLASGIGAFVAKRKKRGASSEKV